VVPGYDGADQSPEVLASRAREVGFPVLVKASAGGGGKGMKRVNVDAEREAAIAAARREAKNAFGDDTLLIEKYVEAPRHVEVQILGDAHGNVVHLNERECSIQRRHQKIIEETPSPALDATLRQAMGEAAVKAAKAIGYQNAGTVEFILAPDRSFYFLEVNTRLQVEHPVTELVTGLDLVELQIRVAEGRALGFEQADVRLEGAAIEARLYAEDPEKGFLPQTGRLADFHLPALEGVRVDGGVEAGSEVSIHYDPMLAKIIAWGEDRPTAIRRLRRALGELSAPGVTTNRAFLMRILGHAAFRAGELDTHFIERCFGDDLSEPLEERALERAAILATVSAFERRRREVAVLPALASGFRNNPHRPQRVIYELGERVLCVEYWARPEAAFELTVDGKTTHVRSLGEASGALVVEADGHRYRGRVITSGERHHVLSDGVSITLVEQPRFPVARAERVAGACVAPMPGKVVAVKVALEDRVTRGQVLVLMEAMKMEHSVCAAEDGVVAEIRVAEGEQVEAEALLVVVGSEA
jgi:3-methylcrotonyl-CoA carboxylase alpha subunit